MSNLSWRAKLMGLFVLVLGASLLFQLFYVLPTIRNQQVEMAQAQQEEVARNIARELDISIDNIVNELVRIADRPEFRNMDIDNQTEVLFRYADVSSDIGTFRVMNETGWVVSGTSADMAAHQKESRISEPYFIASFGQGEVYFGGVRAFRDNTLIGTYATVPIESDTGERVGVLLGSMYLNDLIQNVANYPLEEDQLTYLVDNEGTVIAHSGMDLFALEEGPLSLDFSDEEEVRAIMVGEIAGSGVHEPEGEPLFGTWTTLESNGWGVVVEAPMRAILAESSVLAGRLLSVNAVLFVIALAVSLVFTGQITAERQRVEEALQGYSERLEHMVQERTKALRESEQWLSTTLRSIGDAVIATDAKGLVTLMNPVAEELTGWDEAEAVGQPLEDVFNIINEQTGERAENPVARVLREGVVVGLANHSELIAKDGTKRPIADSGAPMRDEEGKIIGTVMVFRDITERRRAEWALDERVKELTCLYAVGRDIQEDLSIDELCRRVVEHLIPAMQFPEITVPVIELDDRRFAHERYTEGLSHGLQAEIRVGGEALGQLWVYYIEERPFLISEEQNLVNSVADALGLWLERKRAEEALKEYSERLEEMVGKRTKELQDAQEQLIRKERLAVLGQLSGGVGHELRNPLGVISNSIYYLQATLPDADETTKEYLEMISSEVRNSEKIVSDLLDLSRTRPAEREEVAVSDLVAQALEKRPPPEKVKVTTKIAPDLPPVFVDPRQIGQALTNLVTNAYQAMPEGGKLTMSAQGEKDKVYLSITDTGCGISKENMKRLFQPLFTTKAKGIGLGLAVSKNLVEVNGGSIEVESQEGKGSTFTVILPTKKEVS